MTLQRGLAPTHPGEHIREDCILPLGMTITDAAKALDVSRKQLDAIVNGRAGVSPEMAIRLSKAFGGSPGVWLRMQTAFDLWQAEQTADRIKVERIAPTARPLRKVATPPRRTPRNKSGNAA